MLMHSHNKDPWIYMKIGTRPNSKVLISNLTLTFENFGLKYLIWAFLGQKYKIRRFT